MTVECRAKAERCVCCKRKCGVQVVAWGVRVHLFLVWARIARVGKGDAL